MQKDWLTYKDIKFLLQCGENNARSVFKDIEYYIVNERNYRLNVNRSLINRKLALQYLSQVYGIDAE